MLPQSFVQSLVTYADVNGTTGLQEIKDQFNALYARVKAGEGGAIISSSVNGKSFDYAGTATVEELFAAYGDALRQLSDDSTGAVVATYADFSQLQR